MSKLWIAGICQNNAKDLEELLLPLIPHFDKDCCAIFVDGGSTDNTISVLNSYCDVVLKRKWTNDHDFQMNEYLRSSDIKHGDWVLQVDTSERIHSDFLVKLKTTFIPNLEQQNINTVYQRSKPILFKYYDDQIYLGSPHWGLQGQRQHLVDISKFDGFQDDKTYLWSKRDDINKWITNGMKYYYVYGRSNHMWLVYNPKNYPGTTDVLIHEHERNRQSFREYCRNILKLSMDNLEDITSCMKAKNFTDKFIEYMKGEKVLRNYYRYIMGEPQDYIYSTQNSWIFSI